MNILLIVLNIGENVNPPAFFSRSSIDLVLDAGPVSKVVLGILLLFSIISWGIILDKFRVFGKVRRQSNRFLQYFDQHKSVRDIIHASREFPGNPFASVFKEAYWVLQSEGGQAPSNAETVRIQRSAGHSPQDLMRLFDSVASREVLALEKNLSFLATTGSVSPFFGLFGTVWGVMSSFLSIGLTGSADLTVVAPGIAEALITTIAGLGAAIPAVIGYNHFVNKLKRLSAELEIFCANLIEAFGRKEPHEVR